MPRLVKPQLNRSRVKISILTPSFNSVKYIHRAIESVLKQRYTNWEHIIADGGSTDGTVDVIKSYSHLKWVSEPDKGQSDAMNKAFAMSTGDIIVYLNADDWFEDDIFERVVDVFTSGAVVVIGNGTFNYNGEKPEQQWISSSLYKQCLLHFRYKFPLNPFSYFYRREVQEQVGGFSVRNHYTMDYEFILKMLLHYKAVKLETNFGYYFFGGQNKSADRNYLVDCRRVVVRHCLRNDLSGLLYYFYHYYLLAFKKVMYPWTKAFR